MLRNVLDNRAFSLQTAQLTRERNYNDEAYKIHSRHSKKASEWTYRNQKTPVVTDFSEPDTPTPIEVDDGPSFDKSKVQQEAGDDPSKDQQETDNESASKPSDKQKELQNPDGDLKSKRKGGELSEKSKGKQRAK